MVTRAGFRQYPAVILSIVTCASLSLGFAIVRGPLFSSEMTLKSADNDMNVGSATTLRRLASLSGLGGMTGNSLMPAYIDLLQSKEVADLLIRREHFERTLFADRLQPDGTYRRGFPGEMKAAIFPIFGIAVSDRPTVSDVQRQLQDAIVVNQDQITGLVTVGCTSSKPTLCRDLLLAVHREAEYSLAQARYEQAVRTRDYILAKLSQNAPLAVKEAMQDQLSDAQDRIAMNGLERPVAAMIIDPPRVPDEPSFPRPSLIAMFGVLAGLAVGLALAVWREQRGALATLQWRNIAVGLR